MPGHWNRKNSAYLARRTEAGEVYIQANVTCSKAENNEKDAAGRCLGEKWESVTGAQTNGR